MKAKTKFMKMYYKLPERARRDLVYCPYTDEPMTLNVVCTEVRNNTKLSKEILKKMGYIDT